MRRDSLRTERSRIKAHCRFTTPPSRCWNKEIGRLFDKVDQLGLAGNTIVVFSSDNGPEDIHVVNASHSAAGSAGPFRGRKPSLYEGGIRLPFIARWPGHIPAGRVNDQSVLTASTCCPAFAASPEPPSPGT